MPARSTRWVPREGRSRLGHQAAGPDAGRVDDGRAATMCMAPVELVAQRRAVRWRASTRARVRTARRAGGGAGDRGDQPGVVHELAVPGQQAAAQARPGGGRARAGGSRGREPARARAGSRGRCAPPGAARRRRAARPWPRRPGARRPRGQRQHHRHGVGQVRRRALHQHPALDRALVSDADLALREVAQPAVDELGATSARCRTPGRGRRRRHGQPPRDGVQSDPGARDAQPDDDQVDRRWSARRGRGGSGRWLMA